MQHEFSEGYDLLPEIEIPPPPVLIPPTPSALQSTRTANNGCVSITAFSVWALAIWSSLIMLGALAQSESLTCTANLLKMVLYGATALGLWSGYRWAANFIPIICLMLAAEFIIPPTLLIPIALDRYTTHSTSRIFIVGSVLIILGFMVLILGGISWWFWRKRSNFSPHPTVDGWGYRLYLIATAMVIAVMIVDFVTVYLALDELVKDQAENFRQIDRMLDLYN